MHTENTTSGSTPNKNSGEAHNTKRNTALRPKTSLPPDLRKIIDARHHDPFSVLGKSSSQTHDSVLVYLPHAHDVCLLDKTSTAIAAMERIQDTDFFSWRDETGQLEHHYQVQWRDTENQLHQRYDPYCFEAQISDFDLHLFNEGKHWHAYKIFGSHSHIIDGIHGILFAVWAPNAARVSIVGNFNQWDGRTHPMRSRGGSGVWELFIPGLEEGELYKYEILSQSDELLLKSDPYARFFEVRPNTAAVIQVESRYQWQDEQWIQRRKDLDWLHEPMSVYEVHLGSWRRTEHKQLLSYTELAHQLIPYVKTLGFTHIQLLPITEHPLDASWGYQTTGYFAPTSRFGKADDFRYFVDRCHENGLGVIMDWAPGHFPKDAHGLAKFDGTALYEHEDPRRGEHRDWGTLIYNYSRNEVRNFLLTSAIYWIEEFHIDGLRVDAVASMLYLDYSREEGDWIPNIYGGNENLGAIDFLRDLNQVVHGEHPGCLMIAEESTAWPQVTRPVWLGGLGFSMKWNMGWMHDTLEYFKKDPVHRHYHHDQLTFGLLYAFTENFVLPLSHDEVVHGKNSIRYRMPGDEWQQFANLRLLYSYMFTYPGKKLLFMGNEIGQGSEWDFDSQLDWYILEYPHHQGIQRLIEDLNTLYKNDPSFHQFDFSEEGFEWIDCHDAAQSSISYIRKSADDLSLVVLNFTPVPRHNYRIGVPQAGTYCEIFNSDSKYYAGSDVGNSGDVHSEAVEWMQRPHSISLTLPPLAAVVLKLKN